MANLEYTFNIRSVSDHEIRTLELARDVETAVRATRRAEYAVEVNRQAYATADAALSAAHNRAATARQALQAHIAGGRS
jgi:hypothetical protein